MKLPFAAALVAPAILCGCASSDFDRAPATDLKTIKTAYVVKLGPDQRGIERLIAARLTAMGVASTSGEALNPAQPVDAIVTYADRWRWDFTMYMMQLNIEVRDPQSRSVIAAGRVFRPSLQRKSPEGMVEETLTGIWNAQPKPAKTGQADGRP